MWMLAGFAGGIQPWYHHIAAYHEDRRAYRTAGPILRWHEANERYLVDRRPIATVGVVWSRRNTDYFGREDPEQRVDQPWRGLTQALVRARIPYLPVHADHIDREAPGLAVLVLPNLGAMSDAQVSAVRRFVERGGGLIATGESGRFDEWGDPRPDLALGDLLGVSRGDRPRARSAREAQHSYLRLTPELRGRVYGPHDGTEPPATGTRHPALAGFDETDILPFGGSLGPLTVDAKAQVLLTYIPPFPVFPPETSWMREPRTDIPGLVVNEPGGARVAYLPADIDRRFALDNLPDHGDLLANLVRWAARGHIPLELSGRGLLDCELYRQPGRLILHVVNLTSAGTWRAPVHELIPVGPLRVKVSIPDDLRPASLRRLVADRAEPITAGAGWVRFEIESVLDHEVIVIEG
jgi:hypothetical protein